MKIILIFCCLLTLVGCNEVADLNVPGTYKQDKSITVQGKTATTPEELTLLDDHTFTLAPKGNASNGISGKWEVKETVDGPENSGGSEAQAIVRFTYNGKTTIGELKANIFEFRSPYGFHPDVFEYVLYVKTDDT
ncbi:hypothetical protein HYN59_17200 [Flavobacterium album]|uniref:Lipocalin-like domain-containing protein n=1 Tax=Flavobacterium album TaxID=2175091 RepID=A0A2S1R291_9FLAO|nr:hypothetical protein [Flavobacterium album]AWH86737.1 hypothetical protein HYN59_17200 [Flavobacterium album]